MTPILFLITHPRIFLTTIMVLNLLAVIGYISKQDWTRVAYFLCVAVLNYIVAYGSWR